MFVLIIIIIIIIISSGWPISSLDGVTGSELVNRLNIYSAMNLNVKYTGGRLDYVARNGGIYAEIR